MKKFSLLVLSSLLVLGLTGCAEREKSIVKDLPQLDSKNENEIVMNHEVEGIKLSTKYSAGGYDMQNWLITDSKSLNMNMLIESQPEGTEIFIEHVHADISLASKYAQVNGMPQDSMDDSYHGYGQDGIFVSTAYPYEEVFAIEGYSQTLINGWSWYCGDYGTGSISEKRLTEKTLVVNNETYGNKVQVIYNLNIKHAGEQYFHTKTVKDEFYIKTTYVQPEEE